jgi:hypothetical protein
MTVTEAEFREAVAEAAAKVEPYIVGAKHVQVRVITLRRIVAGLQQGFTIP